MKFFKALSLVVTALLLLFLSVYFGNYYMFCAFLVLIFVVAADILLFILPVGRVGFELRSKKVRLKKGEKTKLYIKIKSTRPFPVYSVKFNVNIKNRFYDGRTVKIETSAAIFGFKTVVIPIRAVKSGVIEISITDARTSDMFGLLGRKEKSSCGYTVIVMPSGVNTDMPEFGSSDSEDLPAVNVYLSNNGDVSGYKEYADGDKNSSINWKLFARTYKLFVREFERTSADEAVVLMDMYRGSLDRALDILYSIDYAEGFTLMWLPAGNEEFETAYISDEETLANAVYSIFYSAPESEPDRGIGEYKRLYKGNSILYISDKLELL